MDVKRALSLWLALLLLLSLLSGCGTLLPGWGNTEADPTEESTVRHPRAVEVGGVSIYVDDSKYERYQPAEEICTPISDGPLDEFVPSTGYGDVFPYVAGRLFTGTEDGYGWGGNYLYGLADSKGRMLTGGIYTAAYPLYCYVPGSNGSKQLPFLQLTRYRDASVIHHEDEYGDWDEINATREAALVSMDGTFLLPFSDCYFQGYENCIVATEGSALDDSGVSQQTNFTVYDLQGGILLNSSDLDIDPDCDYVWLQESEGILQVSQVWYEDVDGLDQNRIDYYDLTGKHILGPYKYGSAFTDGLACVSADDTYYGYIDRSGTWVIEPQYLMCEEFQNGFAVQRRSGEAHEILTVLDTTGREVFSGEADWAYLEDDMIHVDYGYDYDLQTSYSEYYDLDGNLLFEGWIDVERISDTEFFVREELENTTRFVDTAHPEKNVTLTGINSGITKTAVCQDGKLINGYFCTDSADKVYLIDADTLEVTALPAGVISDEVMNYYYCSGRQVDAVTGRVWYLAREKGRWVLFDEAGNLILRFSCESVPSVSNGYICATDETSCTVYDTAGNVVFRRRLDAGD